jgi:uncharacterized cupin superfamily protein
VTLKVVNESELVYEEDLHGVRFGVERARLSERLAATKLWYEVWIVPAGRADGPLRFHQVAEHVVWVLGGEPSLRLGAVEHVLTVGELASIPPRPSLPWQILNRADRPARLLIVRPQLYGDVITLPDSGKRIYRIRGGADEPPIRDVVVRGDRIVDVWDGERSEVPLPPPPPAPAARDPRIVHLDDVPWEAAGRSPFRIERKRLAERLGGERLGYDLMRVEPSRRPFAFHHHRVNEELFYVRSGSGTLESRSTPRTLHSGDVICCAPGPGGAHGLRNTGDEPLVYLTLWTRIQPESVDIVEEMR